MSFICKTCGKEHDEWPPDFAFGRPDEVFALPADERATRARESDDFCMLDENRFFIRTVLHIPLHERSGEQWGLGLWVEVSEANGRRYYELYDVDASNEPGFTGRIANAVAYFPDSLGAEVQVKLGPASKRPTLWFDGEAGNSLARAQVSGLSDVEVHDALG